MPYVIVHFDDKPVARVALSDGENTIGRTGSNQIPIDNPGVSANHAVITMRGDEFYIKDFGSKNGTYVNGRKVSRCKLMYGDTISVFKHWLTLVPWVENADTAPSNKQQLIDQSGTVQVDTGQIGDLLAQHQIAKGASDTRIRLRLMDTGKDDLTISLTRNSYAIGKKVDCLVQTSGVLAPPVSARLRRQGGDYLLVPEGKDKVLVNGAPVSEPTLLANGDELKVRKLRMRYQSEIIIQN